MHCSIQCSSLLHGSSIVGLLHRGICQAHCYFLLFSERFSSKKRMPSRTFLFKEEAKPSDFKAHKDRVTLLKCGNAAGFLLKPALINKPKNPKALKNKNERLLPVHWMHNNKAWITKLLTINWFHQCFIPQVRVYLLEKYLPCIVLLFMDNAGGHAANLMYDGVKIDFLPPNATSLIQAMDPGVIRVFKALYTKNAMSNFVANVGTAREDQDGIFPLKKQWKTYKNVTYLENI